MKTLFLGSGRRLLKKILVSIVLMSLVIPLQARTTLAAGKCQTSGPASAAYTLTVCITSPADGATISGSRSINATVTTTGSAPGITKLHFYLAGEYLITDYQSSYTFVLPTTKWVDGRRVLEVEVIMSDGFVSRRTSIALNFNNGIVVPPVNNGTFTPKRGTAPAAGQPFVLAAVGDGSDGTTHSDGVADLIASWNPNLFLYLGDVYDRGTPTEFYNWYGTSTTFYGRFRSITNPIVGNHEYLAGSTAPGYFDYWDNVPRYYSYDTAGWHFIALESNCGTAGICNPGRDEYQWLLNDLNAHPNVCTIAYFHHPVYNVGPQGNATQMNAIWALLAQYGVQIVLTGHDHNYQRWRPLNGNGEVSATGVTQFVVGGGGHGIQRFARSDSRLATGFDTTSNAYGALRLELDQDGANYQFIATAGTVRDSGSIACRGSAPSDTTAPSSPTNLTATATSQQLVQLNWTAATDNVGVTGYSIYRDGSLLTTIGPLTAYSDNTVKPGNNYSYRMRAHDAAGNTSGLSSAATVRTPDPRSIPGAATLISPNGGSNTTTPTYTWQKVSTASWYFLGVYDAGGTNVFGQWYSADQASCITGGNCSVTPSQVLTPGNYNWYIQTWNEAGYGPWSAGKSFSIPAPTPPGAATQVSPSGTTSTKTPSYIWQKVSNASWYFLGVYGAGGNTVIGQWYSAAQAGCATGATQCSITPSQALAAGDYSWYVLTWGEAGYGRWSSGVSFRVLP